MNLENNNNEEIKPDGTEEIRIEQGTPFNAVWHEGEPTFSIEEVAGALGLGDDQETESEKMSKHDETIVKHEDASKTNSPILEEVPFMETEIIGFQGYKIRRGFIDGAEYLIGKDVSQVLGFKNSSEAIKYNVFDHQKRLGRIFDSMGRLRETTVITRPGAYSLSMKANTLFAKNFQMWLSDDVVPDVVETGSYSVRQPVEKDFSLAEFAEKVINNYQDVTKKEILLLAVESEEELSEAKEYIAELEPKAEFADKVIFDVQGDMMVAEAANYLKEAGIDIGRDRLFQKMKDLGWIHYRSGYPAPTQKALDQGLLSILPKTYENPRNGMTMIAAPQVRVKPKGLERLYQILSAALTA